MKKSIIAMISCSFLGIGTTRLYSQSGIVVTGGDASGAGGSVSYTVGQINYNSINGSTGSILGGLQHPFEISVVSGVEVVAIGLSLSVYPIPTGESLTLKIDNYSLENLSYQILDLQGNILRQAIIDKQEYIVPTAELSPSTYFIRIVKNNEPIKIFKTIKK